MANPTQPTVSEIQPVAAIPGGEFRVRGAALTEGLQPQVSFGEIAAALVVSSNNLLIVKVPENATVGELIVRRGELSSKPFTCEIGIQVTDGVHPVASPVVDDFGHIYTTLSGPRGQKTPVSVFRIDLNYNSRPFVSDIMNASGLAIDRDGRLYVSSRYEGIVYEISPSGVASTYVEGMGVATGICFDREDNLYVGDRSGTIFKVSRDRGIFVFATLEPSIAAYHLAWGPDDLLYVTGPTTSSFDGVFKIDAAGTVRSHYRGLGRPQGLAFDEHGRLYVAASMGGHRGIVQIDTDGSARPFVSGSGIVGLAFSPSKSMVITTTNAVYRVDVGIKGLAR